MRRQSPDSAKPWRLGILVAATWLGGCAAPAALARPATPPPPQPAGLCRAWIDHPEAFGRPDLLLGVGSAPLTAPDPPALAQKAALADMAEQVRVHVVANDVSDQRSASADGAEEGSQRLESQVRTSSDVTFEGAAPLDGCTSGNSYFILMGIGRARLLRGPLERLHRLADEISALDARAAALERRGDHLEAARLYGRAVPAAREAAPLLRLVQAVGREEPPGRIPGAGEEMRLARAALGRVGVAVAPVPAEAAPLLAAATDAVAESGLAPAAPDDAELAVVLHFAPGRPSRLYPGLYLARVGVAASLQRRRDGAILAAGQASGHGAGATAGAAVRDGIRRLAESKVPGEVGRLLAALPLPPRVDAAGGPAPQTWTYSGRND